MPAVYKFADVNVNVGPRDAMVFGIRKSTRSPAGSPDRLRNPTFRAKTWREDACGKTSLVTSRFLGHGLGSRTMPNHPARAIHPCSSCPPRTHSFTFHDINRAERSIDSTTRVLSSACVPLCLEVSSACPTFLGLENFERALAPRGEAEI